MTWAEAAPRHGIEPMNDSTFRIEYCDVNVTLPCSRWPWTTLLTKFLSPNSSDCRWNLGVVSVTVPRSDDEWVKLLNDRCVD
jgi:hypothetical protein